MLKLIAILIICGPSVDSARILAYFPLPSISHQVFFRPLTQELAKRGHEVVVITPDPAFPPGKTPENLTEIDVHDISYKIWREAVYSKEWTSGEKDDIKYQISKSLPVILKVFEAQIQTEQIQMLIGNKTEHFDLLLLEVCVRPVLSMTHIFKAPTILVSSLSDFGDYYGIMGAPLNPPLMYPTILRQRLFNLTLWEKLVELRQHYTFQYDMHLYENDANVLINKLFGEDIPNLEILDKNIDMMFLNVYPIWDFNRPVPPNIIYLGGMHKKPEKELPADLKTYLDSSKHGVIYISFGTNVSPSQLPPEKIQMLVNVFSKLPYDVLWKWDQDELPGRTDNIRISRWLPQSDLLRHPKIKLFITQGGLQSTDEALAAGVPLLGVPMLGDQWYNVEQYVIHKIGLRADLDEATEETFLNAIKTLINDESYRANVRRLHSLVHDQPQRPLERAVWWTEHVLRHGGAAHLAAPAANITWAEYLDVELILVIASIVILSILSVSLALYALLGFIKKTFLTSVKLKEN